ncbi:hypothetical protein QR98_0056120 [Sarcoptes scabiei]|uniref:Uncharacterized protein n=1 Tax=Sarcoptes scabiei TaxID=52283 RepID=A0A132A880_SARSC|nr:hypothetical protein QR98_0056120 [Sarcoptes scabiei]
MAYGNYNFKLEACGFNDQCNTNEITLMSAQSTTMCEVIVDSYMELEMTYASVEKCNHPPNASPITYQLFLDSENDPFAYTPMIPLTVPQLSSEHQYHLFRKINFLD